MTTLETPLTKQLDEFQLIQCSILPGEKLLFNEDGDSTWRGLLEARMVGNTIDFPENLDAPCLQILVSLEATRVWLEIQIPALYSGNLEETPPTFSIKGDSISKGDQERWGSIIAEKIQDLEPDTEFPIYQLVSGHFIALLHAELDSQISRGQNSSDSVTDPSHQAPVIYHALLTSHHLISPNKRRSLQSWSASLSVTGFAKVGYPGLIYAQGSQENVEEFVSNIKAMQWLALRVRFVEPLKEDMRVLASPDRKWCEFEKVGEVVEEMRRLGRERFVVEMGIGSGGTK